MHTINEVILPRPLACSAQRVLSLANAVEAHLSPESRLVVHTDPFSMEADKFRSLRVHLKSLAVNQGTKVVMVTSARSGEGKTVAALNLAVSLAEHGSTSVVLVEADLRAPKLAKRLGLTPCPGLSQCLSEGTNPCILSQFVENLGIHLLAAGDATTDPVQVLNSEAFSLLIQQLRGVADWVILDCPPVTPVPDVVAMRPSVDGCVWVVKANVSPRAIVKEAIEQIGYDRLLAVILNEATVFENLSSSYYHHAPLHLLGSGE